MPFDERDYQDPGWCWQRDLHPGNQASGIIPATALSVAYMQARHGARMLGCVGAGFNARGWVRSPTRAIIDSRGSYVGVTDFYVDLPPIATHLVCGTTFAARSSQELTVEHRLTVDGSTGSDDVGTPSETVISGQEGPIYLGGSVRPSVVVRPAVGLRRNGKAWADWPEADLAWCEVELSNQLWPEGSANAVGVRVQLDVRLSTESTTPVGYRPGVIWLGYEVRES